MQEALGISDANRQWVVTAYTLAFGGLLLLGGLAVSQEYMFAARGLQGLFAALLAPSGLSLVTVAFAWVIVREPRSDGHPSYDLPGAALATGGLISLVYGFTRVSESSDGWSDPLAIACLTAAVALIATFIAVERRVKNPLLPLRIPANPVRGGSYLTFLLVGAGLFAMFLFLSYYLQGVLGYSALMAGLHFLAFSLGIILTAGVVARVLPMVGPRPLMIGGLALASTGMLLLVRIQPQDQYWTHVFPSLAMMSIGLALLSTLSLAATNRSVDKIGAVGRELPDGSVVQVPGAESLVAGFHAGFFWGAVLLLLGLAAAAVLVRVRKHDFHANVQDADEVVVGV